MATNKPQSPGNDVDPLLVGVGLLLVVGMAMAFWGAAHTHISTGYAWFRVVQFAPFALLNSVWVSVGGVIVAAAGLTFFFAKKQHARYGLVAVILGLVLIIGSLLGGLFSKWQVFFRESDKSLIEWSHLSSSSLHANLFTLFAFVIPFAIWVARRSLITNPLNHKHFAKGKDYTLHTFTDQMAKQYPHLALFRKLNLTEKSINEGKYRMSDTEKQFAIKHDLLDRVKANEFKVNRDRAAEAFRKQMSKLWTGWNGLSRWEFAVMAVLVPRLAATDVKMPDKTYKEALDMTNALLAGYWKNAAATYDPEKDVAGKDAIQLDLTLAKQAIKRFGGSPKVQKFFKQHAYVGTIIYAMLLEARSLGVLQPAELRWLRVVDRQLWLTVDNVGKIVAFTEIGATYSHFVSEVRQKRAIEKPMIEGAVKGLIEGVDSYMFSEDEVAEINARIDAKEQDSIDVKAVAKNKQNLILSLLVIGTGAKRDIFEVALLAENGTVLYHQRCKTLAPVDEAVQARFGIADDELDALSRLPTSDTVRAKILELCNGHHVITFDRKDLAMVSGMERSAASVEECIGEEAFDLTAMAIMEGVIDEQQAAPIRDALTAATLTRLLWVEKQKLALEAETKAKQG